MAYFLLSWCFNNQYEMEASVKKFFALKNKNWYQKSGRKVALDSATQWPLLWMLNSDIAVSEFEFKLCYYVHFQT